VIVLKVVLGYVHVRRFKMRWLIFFVFILFLGCTAEQSELCGDGICQIEEIADDNCDVDCKERVIDVSEAECGDGICDIDEIADESCPGDCNRTITVSEAECGDGICEIDELVDETCPIDCEES